MFPLDARQREECSPFKKLKKITYIIVRLYNSVFIIFFLNKILKL